MDTTTETLTVEEAKEHFIKHLIGIADETTRNPELTPKQMGRQIVFSTLSTLDGCAAGIPGGCQVIPIDDGSGFLPEEDISGDLHEMMADIERALDA
jgi:hypothetical protein